MYAIIHTDEKAVISLPEAGISASAIHPDDKKKEIFKVCLSW